MTLTNIHTLASFVALCVSLYWAWRGDFSRATFWLVCADWNSIEASV